MNASQTNSDEDETQADRVKESGGRKDVEMQADRQTCKLPVSQTVSDKST